MKMCENKGFRIKKIVLFLSIFLLFGCSINPIIQTSKSIFVVIKTPKLKYADSGFLKRYGDTLKLELFNAGSLVLEISIKDDICINKICYKKDQFNAQMLGFSYPDEMLEDILLKKPMYKKLKNHQKNFTQNISQNGADILYKVTDKTTIFRDKTNNIFIKIKDLD